MSYSKSIFVLILTGTCIMLGLSVYAAEKMTGKVYYRYINEEGVKVLDHSIPPKYVPNGYELVSISGKVLKTVEPAPSVADAERIARERELQRQQEKADKLLRRRYSSLLDIEAAKTRSLQELQGNISILTSNLSNLRNQILIQQEQAANVERSGRTVSDELLKNLSALQAEEKDIQIQIKQRETEYRTMADKFDQDMKRYGEITQPSTQTSSMTLTP